MDAIPWWGWVAIVLGALFTLPYWLGPFLIHGSHKMPVRPEFETLPLEGDVPSDAAEYFSRTGAKLEQLGFTKTGRLAQDKFMPNVRTFVDLWLHSSSEIGAVIVAAYGVVKTAEGVQEQLKAQYVQFSSGFTDESAVMTSNSRAGEVFPPVPGKFHYKFRTDDIAELCQYHQKLDRAMARGKTRKPPPPDPAAHLTDSMNKELTAQTKTGYLYEEEGFFRPTWKGAFLMVYKSLPPLKGMVEQRELRESQRALSRAT